MILGRPPVGCSPPAAAGGVELGPRRPVPAGLSWCASATTATRHGRRARWRYAAVGELKLEATKAKPVFSPSDQATALFGYQMQPETQPTLPQACGNTRRPAGLRPPWARSRPGMVEVGERAISEPFGCNRAVSTAWFGLASTSVHRMYKPGDIVRAAGVETCCDTVMFSR